MLLLFNLVQIFVEVHSTYRFMMVHKVINNNLMILAINIYCNGLIYCNVSSFSPGIVFFVHILLPSSEYESFRSWIFFSSYLGQNNKTWSWFMTFNIAAIQIKSDFFSLQIQRPENTWCSENNENHSK